MKEHPILFSGPMVRAILDGRKTQTRRVVKPQPKVVHDFYPDGTLLTERLFRNGGRIRCPYGVPGDRLWVRETWAHYQVNMPVHRNDGRAYSEISDGCAAYRADGWSSIEDLREQVAMDVSVNKDDVFINKDAWRPPIHMPRWASRITLEVVEVRAKRLQDITELDAISEGIEEVGGKPLSCCPWRNYLIGRPGEMNLHCSAPSRSFQTLWDSINADRAPWDSNPWVWAVTFRRIYTNPSAEPAEKGE